MLKFFCSTLQYTKRHKRRNHQCKEKPFFVMKENRTWHIHKLLPLEQVSEYMLRRFRVYPRDEQYCSWHLNKWSQDWMQGVLTSEEDMNIYTLLAESRHPGPNGCITDWATYASGKLLMENCAKAGIHVKRLPMEFLKHT